MVVHNADIADKFNRLADLLEIEGANQFRVRAYRNAARIVGGMSKSMADMLREGRDLSELPDIGRDLAGKIATIVDTGHLPLLDEVESRTPAELSQLMHIEGLGPKRVKALYQQLEIDSLEDLRQALDEGRIRQLPGFGVKTEEIIRRSLERLSSKRRYLLRDAEQMAEPLVDYLKQLDGIKQLVIAGSYRRRKETVGDLDILITAKRGTPVMEHFVDYDDVQDVVSQGTTRSTVHLRSGLQVDLRLLPEVSYGAALHYFTGSKAHNIAIRKRGIKRGYKISEYGLFKGERRVAGRTEEEIYKKVQLPFIEPELREDRGEIQAAENGALPRLIELKHIKGDLHSHTKATDGHHSLEEMARGAAQLGYEYLGITDHTRHVTVARGQDAKRLRQQLEQIDEANARLKDIVLLKSAEVDILADGSLDLPNSILKELDYTVCSIHYKLHEPEKKQTDRIIKAMDNPYFNILAHPTGRLLNERTASPLQMERLMQAATERGCLLELNASPDRLDLNDDHCRMARELGVKIVISTDAHSTSDLNHMRYGIGQARRGWLEPGDVANTHRLSSLRGILRRK